MIAALILIPTMANFVGVVASNISSWDVEVIRFAGVNAKKSALLGVGSKPRTTNLSNVTMSNNA